MRKASRDIQQEITNTIIEALENGVNPWVCPWDKSTDSALPYNHKTQESYNGMNILMLWIAAKERGYSRNSWLTYKQAQELGATVRKGEKSTMGIFYKKIEMKATQSKPEAEKEFFPMAKAFNVFNVEQIDGLELEAIEELEPKQFNTVENVENLIIKSGVDLRHGGTRAFYRSSSDFVQMPDRERFKSELDYYATFTHELTHWTGHKHRLDRPQANEFGSADYAYEELIAEIGSAFINAELGLVGEVQHESYIASWLKALKEDKRFIFKAASAASKAHKFIFSLTKEGEEQKAA